MRLLKKPEKAHHLSHLSAKSTLRLIPLDCPSAQKRLGLDGRIGMSKQYPVTQRWALALHHWFPEVDGIRYLSRHAGEHRNYCLFPERCAERLGVEEHGELSTLRETVLLAADRYHLEVHWNG